MKTKSLVLLILLVIAVFKANAGNDKAKTDNNTVEIKFNPFGDKWHRSPQKSSTEKTTSEILFIEFSSDVKDITVSIYKDDIKVIEEHLGDIFNGTVIHYLLKQYGQGVYDVHVLSENDLIVSTSITVI